MICVFCSSLVLFGSEAFLTYLQTCFPPHHFYCGFKRFWIRLTFLLKVKTSSWFLFLFCYTNFGWHEIRDDSGTKISNQKMLSVGFIQNRLTSIHPFLRPHFSQLPKVVGSVIITNPHLPSLSRDDNEQGTRSFYYYLYPFPFIIFNTRILFVSEK